jgi:hypothetical protein
MKISQTIITILCAAIGSWITIVYASGAIVAEVKQNTINFQDNKKRIEKLEDFLINTSINQAEIRSDLKYIKEQINDLHNSSRSH